MDSGYAVDEMVNDFFDGTCVSVSNVTYTGATSAVSFFDASDFGLGVNAGLVLSTGEVEALEATSDDASLSTAFSSSGDLQLNNIGTGPPTMPLCWKWTLFPPNPPLRSNTCLVQKSIPNLLTRVSTTSLLSSSAVPGISGTENIAFIPSADSVVVSINNVNCGSYPEYYMGGDCGTPPANQGLDGTTTALTATANVTPGESYHIKIAVADVADHILDSAVFLSVESLCGGVAEYLQPNFNYTVSDNTVTVSNTSQYAMSYEWDFGDGTTYIGENPPPHTYAGRSDETTYTITLTAKNKAGTLSKTFQQEVTVGSTIGVASITATNGLQIYPNPVTDGQLNVKLSETATVRLLDVAGRVLATDNGTQLHFDLTAFGRGMYLLETTANGRMEITKVLY